MRRKNTNLIFGFLMSSILTVLFITLIIANATNLLTERYFRVFFYLGLADVVLFWMFTFLESRPATNEPMGFNEQYPDSWFSRMPLLLKIALVGGVLTLIFAGSAVGLGSAIIDIPQPFTEQSFAVVGETTKVFFESFIPGFFEEAAMFMVAMLIFYALRKIIKDNPRMFTLYRIAACIIAAVILTFGHSYVYGSDAGAYIGIFSFETVNQFFNLYTGAFISWLPHTGHNAAVSLNFLNAFSLGGTMLMMFPIWRRKK